MTQQPETPGSTPRKRRRGGVVIPHPPRWYHWVAGFIIVSLIRLVAATLRYRWADNSGHFNVGPAAPAIYCIWHNRLILAMPAYFGYARKRNRTSGMAAMVSASRDGAFLAAVLECFKVQPVRG